MESKVPSPVPLEGIRRESRPGGPPNQSAEAASSRAVAVAFGALLVGMTLTAYLPALRAGFVFDDGGYVTENETLRTLAGLGRIWSSAQNLGEVYYPLTFSSLWLDYHLWGLNPLGYHLVNILLHALNAVLLWRVLRRLDVPGAWVAAAIFALHPIQVESVAWVTERKNVLSGACGLGALLVFLKHGGLEGRIPLRAYLAVALLYLAASLSKSVTLGLPAVIVVLAWWKHGRIERRLVGLLAPLLLMGLVLATGTVLLERHNAGSGGLLSMLERGLVAGRAFWFYPSTLLWPHALTFIYPRWSIDVFAWWQYLFPAAALAVLLGLYAARGRIGKGPLAAALTYVIMFVPTSGFVNFAYIMGFSFVADRFAYLPSIPLIALAGAGGAMALQHGAPRARFLAPATSMTLLLVLGVLTAWQCRIYRDSRTLWTDTLAKNPACWMAHTNLGFILKTEDGDLANAIAHYEQALRLHPSSPEVHSNLAMALAEQGKAEEAIAHYEQALRLSPRSWETHYNLGRVLAEQGRSEDAITHFTQVLLLNPDFPAAHYNLGIVLAAQGKTEEAITQYTEALRLNPDYPEAHSNLGVALAAKGKIGDAITQYAQALQLKPDYPEAYNNLGNALRVQGRLRDAVVAYKEALRLSPDSQTVHYNLARALVAQGQIGEAISHYAEVVRLKPDFAAAHYNLASLLLRQGRLDEAKTHFTVALELQPDQAAAHRGLGIVLAQTGERARALAELETAVRLDPGDADSQKQLELLKAQTTGVAP